MTNFRQYGQTRTLAFVCVTATIACSCSSDLPIDSTFEPLLSQSPESKVTDPYAVHDWPSTTFKKSSITLHLKSVQIDKGQVRFDILLDGPADEIDKVPVRDTEMVLTLWDGHGNQLDRTYVETYFFLPKLDYKGTGKALETSVFTGSWYSDYPTVTSYSVYWIRRR